MERFYTLLTNAGINALIAARANNTEIRLTKMAVGDGQIVPSQNITSLQSEKYRFNINSLIQDENNPSYLIVEGVIPSDIGGFYVSEVGLYTDNNILFAIGSLPKTYKPELEEGSVKDLTLKVQIEVSNADTVNLKIDDTVVLATRKFVQSELLKYAFINGDETKKFKVADAIDLNEAINKKQLNEATNRIGLFDYGYEAKTYHIIAFGGEFNRTDYPKLWAYLQANPILVKTQAQWQTEATTNGGICGFFSDGNGTTTFRVPNLDKAFLRPDSRPIASYQVDEFKSHTHITKPDFRVTGNRNTWGTYPGNWNGFDYPGMHSDMLEKTGGAETRPKNIAVLPLIVAK